MDATKKHKHFKYKLLGLTVCRKSFIRLLGISDYCLNEARSAINENKHAKTIHGNALAVVQAQRAKMMSALQGIIYADFIAGDEEKIQTGAVYVNITENTLVKMAHRLISDLWLQNKLPAGDSRCRDSPPTENMVRTAVASLRNAFGANIIFAKDSGKWFICKKCFDFKEKSRIGFASDEERAILTKADDAHKLEHRQARAHMINNARNSSNHPNLFTMILLDGTPGPTI